MGHRLVIRYEPQEKVSANFTLKDNKLQWVPTLNDTVSSEKLYYISLHLLYANVSQLLFLLLTELPILNLNLVVSSIPNSYFWDVYVETYI